VVVTVTAVMVAVTMVAVTTAVIMDIEDGMEDMVIMDIEDGMEDMVTGIEIGIEDIGVETTMDMGMAGLDTIRG